MSLTGARRRLATPDRKDRLPGFDKAILDVRNDLYHHRPISNRQTCVDACERLLDHFDGHIGALDEALSNVVYVRPTFKIGRHARHDIAV
ncbi:hypothetical protein [Sinorhizobium fredii]|uniref:hypothetical protein n=1 Tax=Rhizobium fredii TaxID=380 RepID=UPI0011D1FFB7|nr:hypothetical protein [Sinorhizobium fredii]